MATILVVDDRPVDREFLSTLLRYRGHVVLEAADGEEALARARAERPDLIVADILMPRMDGYRLVRELRADPELAGTSVLFYTASYDSRAAIELAEGFGVTLLGKPSEPEAILDAVAAALARPSAGAPLPPEEFDRRHLQLLGDRLYQKAAELEEANARLLATVAELRDEVENRRRAERAEAEGREWLRVVLKSIGDAVIATDAEVLVSFLNPTAEAMTGWSHAEAAGRPLEEVFRIVNEETRGPAESPVAKVLRDGTVHGLANHTLLIARDGSTRPIEDSAAPIRDASGTIRGVVMVFHDVGERREMERQLRDRAERLAEADRRKDEFLVMLAHELRGPLGPIRTGIHVLQRAGDDPEAIAETCGTMQRQVAHMARLIEDLLDVSKILRHKMGLRPERLDLAEVVRQAVVDHRPRAESSGVSLRGEPAPSPIWVDADPTRLKQVADNLVENALKFSEPGGRVAVSVAEDPAAGSASLTVRDSGIGIAADVLPRIFDPFVQADLSLDRTRGGLGLGLALVRGLVELHGGSVEAHSAGPGLGAQFTIRLPSASGAAAPAGPGPAAPETSARLRILLIEDHRDAAETLGRLLRLHGYSVTVAPTGLAGLEEARRSRPDVVVCDIGLPGMDGFAVASALRADPATAGARLIALTGYGREEDRARAYRSGFDDHLVKPADPDELLAKIGHAGP